MPFTCLFQLNNGALDKEDQVNFVEFIYSSLHSFHHAPVPIAKVFFNGRSAEIWSTCPCYLSSYAELVNNQIIDAGTIIGYFAANGEDIPYNKPYAAIKLIDP